MVSGDGGQLYTIEGIAAALIMVMTAYMVVNATSIYTAGDTHISDMQLETLGNDALTVMDMPRNVNDNENPKLLRNIIRDSQYANFDILRLVDASGTGPVHKIKYDASYSCRDASGNIQNVPMTKSDSLTGGEHTVRATKWIIVDSAPPVKICDRYENQTVLVEVLLWRD